MSISMVLISSVVFTIVVVALGVTIMRRVLHNVVAEGHNDVLVPIFLTAGTIYAVFLAFLVVAVWESYDAAHSNAAEEASALSTLYRASTAMDKESGGELRKLVREYTEAVIHDEWAIQAKTGGASPKARTAGLGMYRMFGAQAPALRVTDTNINATALSLINQMQADRNKRTLQAGESLPMVMWIASIGCGALVICMTFLLYMERLWPHILMSSVMGAIIALLLSITYVMSNPFGGQMALTAEPFEHSMGVYDSVDKTP